jgi:diguanylate cyclase (GGDEF)-like protein
MNLDQEIKVTVSLGVATYPHNSISNSDQLIQLADEAMYAAKNTGRNRVVSY